MTIQRHDLRGDAVMRSCADGDYVTYDDHVTAMAEAYRDGAAMADAYRAGAEAMREACMAAICRAPTHDQFGRVRGRMALKSALAAIEQRPTPMPPPPPPISSYGEETT